MQSRVSVALSILALAASSAAQQPAHAASQAAEHRPLAQAEDSILGRPPTYTPAPLAGDVPDFLPALLQKQFGKQFEVFTGVEQPLMTGDFNGDGIEDALIVVRSRNPMLELSGYDVKAFSPEEEFYGFGDPSIMAGTEHQKWQLRKLLLVIHGDGQEAWRAEKPKGKYLLINLPWDRIYTGRSKIKKKPQDVISGESNSLSSVVYWNGKKYKFEPVAALD